MDEFIDVDDCINKIEYYLDNFSEIRTIAKNGYNHVMQNHTYTNRANFLLDIIKRWHDGERGVIQ